MNNQTDGSFTTQDLFVIEGNTFRDFTTQNATLARAIYFQGTSGKRCFRDITIAGNVVKNIGRHGITLDYSDNVSITGNTVKSVGVSTSTGFGIAVFESGKCAIAGNVVEDCWDTGINVQGTSGDSNTVSGNMVRRGGKRGINVESISHCAVVGNIVTDSYSQGSLDGYGIRLATASDCLVSGNVVRETWWDGIYLTGSSHNAIVGNSVKAAGRGTTGTYSGIRLDANSDSNHVHGNTVRQAASGNLQKYGLRIEAATCDTNKVTDNDLLSSGSTSSYSDAGTGTITTSGNRV